MRKILIVLGLVMVWMGWDVTVPTTYSALQQTVPAIRQTVTKLTSTRHVKVQGRQLLVDFDGNGVYEPFIIKGVGYSPYPIGRHPSDWDDNIFDNVEILNRDFDLLQAMGCNTIRIWKGDNTQQADGRFKCKITQKTLDLAQQHNIKVIAGFWIDTSGAECIDGYPVYHVPGLSDPTVQNRFGAYVNSLRDLSDADHDGDYTEIHPAILFWAVGNENNLHLDPANLTQIRAWYSLVNQMADRAHQIEGASYHPVAVVNGDLLYAGDANYGTSDAQMNYLDIWGTNVYRGDSFGNLFNDFKNKSNKPLWIAEYGLDAWYTLDFGNPENGHLDENSQAQWVAKLWDELSLRHDVAIGGTVMEYSDEWWKPYEWIDGGIHNNNQDYFGTGPVDGSCPPDGKIDWWPPSPDNFFNAEWFGIMAISLDGSDPDNVDDMHPRMVYNILKEKFASSVCGDANNDGKVTISDVVYLINYLFKGGPAPTHMESADANGDGSITSADCVYLINYLFKGGPAPKCL